MTTQSMTTTTETGLALAGQLPADQNPVLVYLAQLGQGSRATMRGALDSIARLVSGGKVDAVTLDWSKMRFQHTAAIRSKLAETYAPATANKMLSALRGVLKSAWRLGQMDAEAYHRARDVANVKGETLPAGRAITAGELSALLLACERDAGPAGARDAALVAVGYSCGLRRAELVNLNLGDYDATAETLVIRGKGNKERLAHAVNGARLALTDWLTIRGSEPGALFVPIRKGGRIQQGQRLTTQAVYHILQTRANQAGVKDVSPHDLRRSFVSDLLDAGADISTVQRLAGHASPTTTSRYDRRPEAAKRQAASLLHVPYRATVS